VHPSTSPPEAPAGPRVSAVIVTWNCEAAVRRCLAALEKSKERGRIEVFVVDAGSHDGSPQVDSEFPHVTVLRLPRNFGRTRARNIALRSAAADLVLFLSPDVEVEPGAIPLLADALENTEHAGAASPALFTPEGRRAESSFRLPSAEQLRACCGSGAPLPEAADREAPEAVRDIALMIRRSFLQGMNYLDEKRYSHHWAELEIFWQIRNAGKRVLLVEDARATLHPPEPGPPLDAAARALLACDRVAGAASWIGKHHGFASGLRFYLGFIFTALGRLVIFREPEYHWRLLTGLLMGHRLDGTQGGVLG
jgi:glycosyltransferase involved in cell wall biosynthesis